MFKVVPTASFVALLQQVGVGKGYRCNFIVFSYNFNESLKV